MSKENKGLTFADFEENENPIVVSEEMLKEQEQNIFDEDVDVGVVHKAHTIDSDGTLIPLEKEED